MEKQIADVCRKQSKEPRKVIRTILKLWKLLTGDSILRFISF